MTIRIDGLRRLARLCNTKNLKNPLLLPKKAPKDCFKGAHQSLFAPQKSELSTINISCDKKATLPWWSDELMQQIPPVAITHTNRTMSHEIINNLKLLAHNNNYFFINLMNESES